MLWLVTLMICCFIKVGSERKGSAIYYSVTYREWSETKQKEVRTLEQVSVPQSELFLRKLVDATLIHSRLWGHISNERTEEGTHSIYAAEFADQVEEPYRSAITKAVFALNRTSSLYSGEYWIWDGQQFMEQEGQAASSLMVLEWAQRLLDHYVVEQETTYEVLYSVLDEERKKLLFFLKEVDL
ncbi:hypothetical protein Q5741_09555 [Paenibacillus sp. JX-17]|uniref:Uncharacterized protein n=1 Tax=Paenibacillus lacisoli TaxID=3064525 RepID=A0ABT9CBL8_9BACL|nr:hypothetical protein [Paenibacillus sp. JX-17]MDO7906666.1 hypothetical protein [Paenibacillus sp. JX-17]